MSADNEVAVVKFDDGYKVEQVSSSLMSELYTQWLTDEESEQWISQVFTGPSMHRIQAIDWAHRVKESLWYCEYGVCIYDAGLKP